MELPKDMNKEDYLKKKEKKKRRENLIAIK